MSGDGEAEVVSAAAVGEGLPQPGLEHEMAGRRPMCALAEPAMDRKAEAGVGHRVVPATSNCSGAQS